MAAVTVGVMPAAAEWESLARASERHPCLCENPRDRVKERQGV